MASSQWRSKKYINMQHMEVMERETMVGEIAVSSQRGIQPPLVIVFYQSKFIYADPYPVFVYYSANTSK